MGIGETACAAGKDAGLGRGKPPIWTRNTQRFRPGGFLYSKHGQNRSLRNEIREGGAQERCAAGCRARRGGPWADVWTRGSRSGDPRSEVPHRGPDRLQKVVRKAAQ